MDVSLRESEASEAIFLPNEYAVVEGIASPGKKRRVRNDTHEK
jgi:hypothetical protein